MCYAVGEKGTLRCNGLTGDVELFEESATSWKKLITHQTQRDDISRAERQDLLESIQEKKNPFVTGDDGMRVLEIIESARISANTRAQK